jgi:hypothetical protein
VFLSAPAARKRELTRISFEDPAMTPDSAVQTELLSYLVQLGSEDQAKVVNLARTLAKSPKRGTPGKQLLRIVGTIPHDELQQMKHDIEEACERIDANEW